MKIVMITGSGKRRGTSSYLADEFIRGYIENGNQAFRFDTAFMNLTPCIGCNNCKTEGNCIWKDDFQLLIPHLVSADEVVFVTPVYYMNMTAQLKTAVDRMYQLEKIDGFRGNKKYLVLSSAWDSNKSVFEPLMYTIKSFCRFLKWKYAGAVLAAGVDTREDVEKSSYEREAYELGAQQ